MHTVMLILAGLALLLVFYVASNLMRCAFRRFLPAYLVIWALAAAANGWIGVAYAGYSIATEALVFLPVFGVPALAALLLARRG